MTFLKIRDGYAIERIRYDQYYVTCQLCDKTFTVDGFLTLVFDTIEEHQEEH